MSNKRGMRVGSVVEDVGKKQFMTIQEFRKHGDVMCVWFRDGKGYPFHGLFKVRNLRLVEK